MSLVLEKRGIVTYSCRSDSFCGERAADDLLRLLDDGGEMFIALQALGVEFVDVFAANQRRTCEFCRDRFACEFCGCDGFGREFLKQVLLLGRGGSVDAGIEWRSQFDGHFLVVLARVFPVRAVISAASRLRMMQSLSVLHTVPLCRREAGARAFLAAEAGSLPKAMMSNRSFRLTRLV